jgi:hypothetical protein
MFPSPFPIPELKIDGRKDCSYASAIVEVDCLFFREMILQQKLNRISQNRMILLWTFFQMMTQKKETVSH